MGSTEQSSIGSELWSVFDFARRYRLTAREQNRLLMLFGPVASAAELLSNARRNHSI
ncbi:hypothetical protein JNB88_27905 [Rhizobium cauense]|uniref:hypothetical protein n=1 Tax=Rhizobium cauense TaxID=1166683 RepID=UPI0018CF1042|nr:hypothetical protein [Rhizobium cauense]MBW9117450.1 hypothetical protein [Rhizobium cauense]